MWFIYHNFSAFHFYVENLDVPRNCGDGFHRFWFYCYNFFIYFELLHKGLNSKLVLCPWINTQFRNLFFQAKVSRRGLSLYRQWNGFSRFLCGWFSLLGLCLSFCIQHNLVMNCLRNLLEPPVELFLAFQVRSLLKIFFHD